MCRPGMSPVMMAALMENESMLKFLFARGAKPLELPEYDPSDMNNIIRFDAIYQTFVAVSKPMYLCIMNEDPVMVAFKELFLFLNVNKHFVSLSLPEQTSSFFEWIHLSSFHN